MKTSWWQKFTIRGSVILAKNLKGRKYPKFANIVLLNNRAIPSVIRGWIDGDRIEKKIGASWIIITWDTRARQFNYIIYAASSKCFESTPPRNLHEDRIHELYSHEGLPLRIEDFEENRIPRIIGGSGKPTRAIDCHASQLNIHRLVRKRKGKRSYPVSRRCVVVATTTRGSRDRWE